jgi:hypothetical protein
MTVWLYGPEPESGCSVPALKCSTSPVSRNELLQFAGLVKVFLILLLITHCQVYEGLSRPDCGVAS